MVEMNVFKNPILDVVEDPQGFGCIEVLVGNPRVFVGWVLTVPIGTPEESMVALAANSLRREARRRDRESMADVWTDLGGES